MLTPGTVLQNRYRIASPLGQGGMGAVYRAWDLRLNIPVAVKEMVPQPGIDPHTLAQLRQQFYQEAQVLARLNHPNLVRVTDYFEEWGNAYLVMDFAEGQSLADLIAARGPLPEAQVLEWARQLLDALAYCHSQGVIHRDIKPQNIIIRPDGQAVLVDFGLVKLWDPRDPRTRTVVRAMGTPEYAPPEQWGAGHTDPRSDLYSLGATLYHALTGQAPATATDRFAAPTVLTPPRSINPSLRPETERAILRAMELAKDARWGSAAEMAAALGAPAAAPTPAVKPAPPQPTRVIAEEQPQPTRVIPEPSPQPVRVTAETPPQPTRVITEAPPPAIPARSRIPVWAWVLGGVTVLALLVAGVYGVTLRHQWSAQAQRIAFSSNRDGNYEIYVMNADGSGITRLTYHTADDWFPSWSPDGRRIVFVSNRDGNYEVYVMNADGSSPTRLTNDSVDEWRPFWSPDGKRIVFAHGGDGIAEVYAMNADGSEQTNLTNHPSDDWDPSWSPDGKHIAFEATRDGNEEIYVMNADGSYQANLTNHSGNDRRPSWSPDGRRIVFQSDRDGNWEIYVMNANGSNQIRLTNSPAADVDPCWSPDGRRIAFASKRDGNWEIYVMNADGSNVVRLTNNPATDWFPSWSPAP